MGDVHPIPDVDGIAGSPWGAGTLASSTGARQPSALELEVAKIQGQEFYETVARFLKD